MKPKYYQTVIWLTIIECTLAFTLALSLWVNLVPIWMAMPDAEHLTQFEKYITSGYGFWGAVWALPNYIMLKNTDIAATKKWATMAGLVYIVWWVFWWGEIWNGTWQWYVVWIYVPLRIYQVCANIYYGLVDAKA
jgi:hypothetical protein